MEQSPRWLTAEEQECWRAFIWTAQLFHESLDRQLQRDSGIPHAHYIILMVLSEAPNHTYTMSELSHNTMYSSSRLSHAVSQLEKRGWVERHRDVSYPHEILASLTNIGFAALTTAVHGHVNQVRRLMMNKLSNEELEALRRICDKLLESAPDLDEE